MPHLIREAEQQLQAWETRLSERVLEIRLLAELDISKIDCEGIGQSIHALVRAYGQSPAIQKLRSKYPITLAAFLVAEGVYYYRGGNYWSDICRRTGISHQNCVTQLGPAFEKILAGFLLPTFPQLEFEAATRYVSKFLAHGGIPDYSLDDFFAKLLLPAATRLDWASMGTAELVEEWRGYPSRFVNIDKPVRRFLFYGGRVALDFVDRCKQMVERTFDDHQVPAASELGLPSRVVESFGNWFHHWEMNQGQTLARVRTNARYRKPLVSYDPWDGTIVVEFPEQILEPSFAPKAEWLVAAGEITRTIPLALYNRDGLLESDAKTYVLDRPAKSYEFSLVVNDQMLRTWQFPGMSKDHPLTAFDPESGKLISWHDVLPAAQMWVIVPGQYELAGAHDGQTQPIRILEEFPPLGRSWGAYRGLHLDCSAFESIVLTAQADTVRIPLQVQGDAFLEPRLVGGYELSPLTYSTIPIRIFSAPLPQLMIPLNAKQHISEVKARMVLLINNAGVALKDLDFVEGTDHQCVLFDLDQPGVLGADPVGDFKISVRGALGSSTDFYIRLLPEIHIEGHETLYAPSREGKPPVAQLKLRIPNSSRVENESASQVIISEPLPIRNNQSEYRIEVGSEITKVRLALHIEGKARLPFEIPLRRLRWALMGIDESRGSIDWKTSSIRISRDILERAVDPELLIDLPANPGQEPELKCVLYDADWTKLQDSVARKYNARTKFHSFRLKEFLDTLRQSDAAELNLVLQGTLNRVKAPPELLFAPAVRLTRHFTVTNFELISDLRGDVRSILLSWQQAYRVRNRVVRFWPFSRPWSAPWEVQIPDNNLEVNLQVPSSILPPGKYRVEFETVNAWAANTPNWPSAGAENAFDVTVGRRDEIDQYLAVPGRDTLKYLESYLVFGDGRALIAFDRDFTPEYIPHLLDTLLAITASDGDRLPHIPQADVTALATILLRSLPSLLRALAARTSDGDLHSLRLLLLRLGFPALSIDWEIQSHLLSEKEREALWELWNPLGLWLDGNLAQKGDEGALRRALRHLGRPGVELLGIREHSEDGATADPLSRVDSQFFGGRIEAWQLAVGAAQLKAFARQFIFPQSLLDVDTWALDNIEWIEWMKSAPERTQQVSSFVARALSDADVAVSDLDLQEACYERLLQLVSQRRVNDEYAFAGNMPFLSGVTALVLRLIARQGYATRRLAAIAHHWQELASELFAIAPQLLTRDFCMIDLVLAASESPAARPNHCNGEANDH